MFFLLYSTLKDRKNHGIILIALTASLWVLGSFAEIISAQFEFKLFWRNFTQIGVCFLPVAMLYFSTEYAGTSKKVRTAWMITVSIIAFTALTLIWTDQQHNLMRTSVMLTESSSGMILKIKPTIFGMILMSYVSASHLLSEIFLITFLKTALPNIKKKIFLIIAALGFPVIYIIIKSFFSTPFLQNFPIAISFIPMTFLLVRGVVSSSLSSISPIALSEIFNAIDELIIITDPYGRILDMNESAGELFTLSEGSESKNILKLDSHWYDLILGHNEGQSEFVISKNDDDKAYRVVVHPLNNNRNRYICSISILRNISEERRIRHNLISRAETDGLTGCLNKSAFEAEAERIINVQMLKGQSLALIMFDLDHFKKVNDSFGHAAGDIVLKALSANVKKIVKAEDRFGRLGGEEFGVLIENKERQVVSDIAERIRKAVEGMDIHFEDKMIKSSVSIGCALIEPGQNIEYQSLFKEADLALYEAKNQGRNVVYWYSVQRGN
ncbi:MAG: diguanylate cyclase [Spirochaetales bacterium]|nr:diguanylate cyclase [Spirochaetales bacterium]